MIACISNTAISGIADISIFAPLMNAETSMPIVATILPTATGKDVAIDEIPKPIVTAATPNKASAAATPSKGPIKPANAAEAKPNISSDPARAMMAAPIFSNGRALSNANAGANIAIAAAAIKRPAAPLTDIKPEAIAKDIKETPKAISAFPMFSRSIAPSTFITPASTTSAADIISKPAPEATALMPLDSFENITNSVSNTNIMLNPTSRMCMSISPSFCTVLAISIRLNANSI